MKVLSFTVGPLDNNTYLVSDERSGDAVVVDPGYDSRFILDEAGGLHIVAVLNTHTHFDHVAENAYFAERTRAPLMFHTDDLPLYQALAAQAEWFMMPAPKSCDPGRLLRDGDTIEVGNGTLQVVHTPGHSPGGVCFVGEAFVIAGDTLFAGSVGRTDLPGGDMAVLIRSIRTRLLTLPDGMLVYPGHGPATTIGEERRGNPFL